jgi:calcineurin-like phosphoesterase family protein
MSIWGFTSDQHFGHVNILAFAGRPYANLTEMHEALIANYNAMVPEDATVIHVGDVFMRATEEEARAILGRLNGQKILVRGNHDGGLGRCHRFGFDIVVEELHMEFGGRPVRVSHFPYRQTVHRNGTVDQRFRERRPRRIKGEVLVHGHTHRPLRREGNMIHVGVDAWDYHPVPMAEVEALVREV